MEFSMPVTLLSRNAGFKFPGWKLGPNATCYLTHTEPQRWSEAHSSCHSAGGHLALLDSREEAEHLRDAFKQVDQHSTPGDFAFLGFTDLFQRYHYRTVLGEISASLNDSLLRLPAYSLT